MRRLLVLLSALWLVACPQPTPRQPVVDASDGATPIQSQLDAAQAVVDAVTACSNPLASAAAACANAAKLGCAWAKPTPRLRESCECRYTRYVALGELKLNLGCVALAKSCAAVDACGG
jgi:hypothetical protein